MFTATLRKMVRHGALQNAMMNAVGVRDRLFQRPGNGAVLRRAANRCLACSEADACGKWLNNNSKADSAPHYCRNHDLFERIKHEIEADTAT